MPLPGKPKDRIEPLTTMSGASGVFQLRGQLTGDSSQYLKSPLAAQANGLVLLQVRTNDYKGTDLILKRVHHP